VICFLSQLKDHINLHFIGQVKRKHESETESTNGGGGSNNINATAENEPSVKKMKVKIEQTDQTVLVSDQAHPAAVTAPKSAPHSPTNNAESDGSDNSSTVTPPGGQLKCNSCEIGFSHLSNFVAHKKYYCRGLPRGMKSSSPPIDVRVGSNGKESPPSK
jgi:hypothetical protein